MNSSLYNHIEQTQDRWWSWMCQTPTRLHILRLEFIEHTLDDHIEIGIDLLSRATEPLRRQILEDKIIALSTARERVKRAYAQQRHPYLLQYCREMRLDVEDVVVGIDGPSVEKMEFRREMGEVFGWRDYLGTEDDDVEESNETSREEDFDMEDAEPGGEDVADADYMVGIE